MVVSQSPASSKGVVGRVMFDTVILPLQSYVRILGVYLDQELHCDSHLKNVARQTSLRVSSLRRVSSFLEKRGILLLKAQECKAQEYKAQEYWALIRMSSTATHLQRLDEVEWRVQQLLQDDNPKLTPQDVTQTGTRQKQTDRQTAKITHNETGSYQNKHHKNRTLSIMLRVT